MARPVRRGRAPRAEFVYLPARQMVVERLDLRDEPRIGDPQAANVTDSAGALVRVGADAWADQAGQARAAVAAAAEAHRRAGAAAVVEEAPSLHARAAPAAPGDPPAGALSYEDALRAWSERFPPPRAIDPAEALAVAVGYVTRAVAEVGEEDADA